MRPLSLGGLLTCVVLLAATPRVWSQLPTFRRGDSNVDSIVDISDAIHALKFLFLGDPKELACQDAADVNGDCVIDLFDLATLLGNFGTPDGAALEDGDLDGDGDVDLTDLVVILSAFGNDCR